MVSALHQVRRFCARVQLFLCHTSAAIWEPDYILRGAEMPENDDRAKSSHYCDWGEPPASYHKRRNSSCRRRSNYSIRRRNKYPYIHLGGREGRSRRAICALRGGDVSIWLVVGATVRGGEELRAPNFGQITGDNPIADGPPGLTDRIQDQRSADGLLMAHVRLPKMGLGDPGNRRRLAGR